MSLQPFATVKRTVATPFAIVIGPFACTMPCDGQVAGGGPLEQPCLLTLTTRASAGESPLPHFATSCTFTTTLFAEPAENVPENVKPLSRPKWPLATCERVEPPSVGAHPRTSLFVRELVVASEPFQAVAV